jgi:hypothetical protein
MCLTGDGTDDMEGAVKLLLLQVGYFFLFNRFNVTLLVSYWVAYNGRQYETLGFSGRPEALGYSPGKTLVRKQKHRKPLNSNCFILSIVCWLLYGQLFLLIYQYLFVLLSMGA